MSTLLRNIIDSFEQAPAKGTILRSMAIFTGIEFCGKVLIGKTGQGTSKESFKLFCNSKYMPSNYHQFSELLYKLFRCGVLHTYTPKGGALLSSEFPGSKSHLKCYEDGLFIYIPKLAEDVKNAIENLIDDINKNNQLAQNYMTVINNLAYEGNSIYQNFLNQKNISPLKGQFNPDIGSDINQNR